MKINKNDPRLTSYLLNELNDTEKKIIEAAIATDFEIRLEIEKLQKSITSLQKNSVVKSDFRLTDQQRSEIFKRISKKKNVLSRWQVGFGGGGLLAAGLALFIFTHSLKNEVSKPMYEATKPAQSLSESAILAEKATEVRPAEAQKKKKEISMHAPQETSISGGSAAMVADELTQSDETARFGEVQQQNAQPQKQAARYLMKQSLIQKSVQLISTKPEIENSLSLSLQKQLDQCFHHAELNQALGSLEISWMIETQKIEVTSSRNSSLITTKIKNCLMSGFKTISLPKSSQIVLKLQIVTKSNNQK